MRNLCLLALVSLLNGCATPPQTGYAPQHYIQAGDDSEEVLPPLPTFTSLDYCEQAYGAGSCATGAQVYARAALPAPPYVNHWYMPYEYSGLTGSLAYAHLAPPAPYVSHVYYHRYITPVYVTRYQVVTPVVVQRYRAVPVHQREVIVRQGPSHYDHRRGVVAAPRDIAPPARVPSPQAPAVRPAPPAGGVPASSLVPQPGTNARPAIAPVPGPSAPPGQVQRVGPATGVAAPAGTAPPAPRATTPPRPAGDASARKKPEEKK
jgi:hypothetical protein